MERKWPVDWIATIPLYVESILGLNIHWSAYLALNPTGAEIFSGQLGQYHGCWCTVSSRRQVIISHGIYCVGQTGIWPDLTESVDMFHVPWNNIAHNKLIHSFNGLMYNQQTQLCMWGDLWMSERSVSHIYVVECIQNIWYDVYVQINPSKKI